MSAVSIERWRQSGAKDAVGVLSGEALRQCLQAAFGSRPGIQEGALPPPDTSTNPLSSLVVEDTEGFDCRVGDRARRRKRVAHSAAEANSPGHDSQSGPPTAGAEKKRGKSAAVQLAAKSKKLVPSNLSKVGRANVPRARAPTDSSPAKVALSSSQLPAGWQLHLKKRPVGRQVDKLYFSPEGRRYSSWKRVIEHCIIAGIPVPHDDSEDEEDTTPSNVADIRSWLLAAAAHGRLPKARLFQYAVLRARQALSIAPHGRPDD